MYIQCNMYQDLFQIQEIQYNSFYGNASSFRLQIQCRYNVSSSAPDTIDTYLPSRFRRLVRVHPRWEKQGDGGRNTVYIQCIRLWSKYNVYTIGLYHLNLLQIQCIYSVSGFVPNTINTYFPSRNQSFVLVHFSGA